MTALLLVDTSVWIDLLGPAPVFTVDTEDILRFATCPPVIQEVFQGLKPGSQTGELRSYFLALPCLADPIPLEYFLEAADIYALGRRKGYTIRSSTDCLIAAIAIQHDIPVLHKDRDFSAIAKFTGLQEMTHFKTL